MIDSAVMHMYNKLIVLSLLLVIVCRPFGANADEQKQKKEIVETIRGILYEDSEGKRLLYVNKLKSYPYDEVSKSWVEILEAAAPDYIKVRIINYLFEYNDKKLVLPIAYQLLSPDIAVRKKAAQVLMKMGDDRIYPVVLKMANSPNPVHRIYFIEAMNLLYDRRFYSSLANMLQDENKSIRIYVLHCLRENRISESLRLIRNAALGDKNDEVRVAAIETLGAFRDAGAVNILHMILNDKNRNARLESVKSLSLIGAAISAHFMSLRLLAEEDNVIKQLLLDTLALMKRAGDTRGPEKILLADADEGLRIKAAYILGFSGNQAALMALILGLKDSDYRVRAEVCNSLGNYRNRQALAGLLDILAREETAYVKSASLYAIKRMNDRSCVMNLFDLYTAEKDPVFKEQLREVVHDCIKRFI
jgi:HEAT repeat protein